MTSQTWFTTGLSNGLLLNVTIMKILRKSVSSNALTIYDNKHLKIISKMTNFPMDQLVNQLRPGDANIYARTN